MKDDNKERIDLSKYPTPAPIHEGPQVLAIGDLHANPIKLIYFAIKYNVISMPETDYLRLYENYKRQYEFSLVKRNYVRLNDYEFSKTGLTKDQEDIATIIQSYHHGDLQRPELNIFAEVDIALSHDQAKSKAPLYEYQNSILLGSRLKEIFAKQLWENAALSESDKTFLNHILPDNQPWLTGQLITDEQHQAMLMFNESLKDLFPELLGRVHNKLAKHNQKDYDEFQSLLSQITKSPSCPPEILIRLIGDVVCDRGATDRLVMDTLERVKALQVDYDILLGNHDFQAIHLYENNFSNYAKNTINNFSKAGARQGNSTLMLLAAINDGDLTVEQAKNQFNNTVKKHLKPLAYSLAQDKATILVYHHGAIAPPLLTKVIESIANKLEVTFDAKTPTQLAQTIDRINTKFEEHLKAGKVHELYIEEPIPESLEELELEIANNPFNILMWMRKTPENSVLFNQDHEFILQGHGHDEASGSGSRRSNFDDSIAKYHLTEASGLTPAAVIQGSTTLKIENTQDNTTRLPNWTKKPDVVDRTFNSDNSTINDEVDRIRPM
ncbi:MAG: hypothetical protein M3R00_01700 [Pseudomonadota bacterium]|nr:hypothetical protein [Pseudomonadota bacterium]